MIYRRQSTVKIVAMIVSLIVVVCIIGFVLMTKVFHVNVIPGQTGNPGKVDNTDMQKLMVVVAKSKIEKGENISKEKLEVVERPIEYLPANSVVSIDSVAGKRASAAVEKNQVLTNSLFISLKDEYKPDERLKDCEISGGLVFGLAKEGDFIDLEYVRNSGKRSVVLSKKKIKNKIDANKIIIQTTDSERTMYEAALAEMKYRGGTIKTTLYLDESQSASPVTYTVPVGDVSLGNTVQPQPISQPAQPSPAPQTTAQPQKTALSEGR